LAQMRPGFDRAFIVFTQQTRNSPIGATTQRSIAK
jgi:hypothetical protein